VFKSLLLLRSLGLWDYYPFDKKRSKYLLFWRDYSSCERILYFDLVNNRMTCLGFILDFILHFILDLILDFLYISEVGIFLIFIILISSRFTVIRFFAFVLLFIFYKEYKIYVC